jgi:hypothetical protein
MSVDTALHAALDPIFTSRVWANAFPQEPGTPAVPAVRFVVVSGDPTLDICAEDNEDTDDIRVQLDVIAATYAALKTIKAQVINAMKGLTPPAVRQPGGFEAFDDDVRAHRWSVDYVFSQSSA